MVFNRPYYELEQKNIEFLVSHHIKFTQVQITPTGLKKSILDATTPMRAYFLENGIHNYSEQPQGTENRLFCKTAILSANQAFDTKTSFYRPNTKKGDPRLWIYGLGNYCFGNDIYALFWEDNTLFSINITRTDIEWCFNSNEDNPIKSIISQIYSKSVSASVELLNIFKKASDRWFKSEVNADTGIGRTIESSLGIAMNSAKTPDYKGIELKSYREKRHSDRSVLFTQTPNWDLSRLKSGKEIVDKYGYINSDGFKTYQSTVRNTPNKQNLYLNVNHLLGFLELKADLNLQEDVALWRLITLHDRLSTKHHETFWIKVETSYDTYGQEYFRYKEIEHTYNPNLGQFDILLEQGIISLDMSLCRPSGRGDTYSFKIQKKGMPLLFPQSKTYLLQN